MRTNELFIRYLLTVLLFSAVYGADAQKESFDIATYTRPADSAGIKWTKVIDGNILSFTAVNPKNKNWCRINIVKSTSSKGSIELDFGNEWQELIVNNYKPTGTPQYNPVQPAGDWKTKSGATTFIFNNSNALAQLTTWSGNDRCMSIVATTNDAGFIRNVEVFTASVALSKPATVTSPANGNAGSNDIYGTWVISASDQSSWRVKNGVMSTIWRQYTLNKNGTYTFVSKLFDPMMDNMFLGKESGSYTISGSSISLNPKQSVLESWTRKNGNEWARKISSQKIALEKATYQFSRYYNPVFKEWQLILNADIQTKRDGPYSSNAKGWVYIAATEKTQIKLPIQ